jgi:hypothetical protein
MKYIILFFIFTLSISAKERIVVLDFLHSRNVSEAMAVSSYKYFVSELNKTGEFSIVEKSQMKEVLKEIAFQQTGCTDTACEIKIGEMLAADKIASGNIIKKGDKYIISVNIRKVSDKSLDFSETIDIYDVKELEPTMSILAERIIHPEKIIVKPKPKTQEEIKLEKRNEELARQDIMHRGALLRTLIFPGWGHYHWNQDDSGSLFLGFYTASIALSGVILPAIENKIVSDIERKITTMENLFYIYYLQPGNSLADNFVKSLYLGGWETGMQNKTWDIKATRVISYIIPIAIMVFALQDIQSIKKDKEQAIFSLSIKPESAPALRQTNFYPQKGTHLEFAYTMRF